MTKYELGKDDFKILDFAILLFLCDTGPTLVEKGQARELRERLQNAHTAWIQEDK